MKIQEKFENNRNRNALAVAIIAAVAIIIAAIIPLFKNASSSSKKIEIKTNHNSPVSGDIQTQNNYFFNGSSDSNKTANVTAATESNRKEERTFRLIPSQHNLEQMITENNYILAKTDVRYSIELTYNGEIEKVESNLYRYSGGNILIKVNGENCSEMKNMVIAPTFNGGNSKQIVTNEINEKISQLISKHADTISNKILQCLN